MLRERPVQVDLETLSSVVIREDLDAVLTDLGEHVDPALPVAEHGA